MAVIISEKLCRICVNESYFYSNIFMEQLDDGSHFVDVVNDLLQLDVEFGDGYPQFICSYCYNKICDFEVFKRTAHEGRAILSYSTGSDENKGIKLECETSEDEEFVPVQTENGIKLECESSEDEVFVPVQTELYLVQVKTEDCESTPVENDPLELELKIEPGDPLHLHEDSSENSYDFGFKVSDSPLNLFESRDVKKQDAVVRRQKLYGINMNAVKEDEGRKRLYDGNTVLNMESNDESDIACEGSNNVMGMSLSSVYPNSTSNEDVAVDRNASYNCNFSRKGFCHKEHLEMHQIAYEEGNPFKCDSCDKTFTCKDELKVHVIVHAGEKAFKCNYCDKTFSRSYGLKQHTKVHTGECKYECSYCYIKFPTSSRLIEHERVHTGEKPFNCKICGKKFSSSSSMKKHERLHTGERPFKCGSCDKSFSSNTNLKIHERVHSGIKTYKCSSCDKSFSHPTHLRDHERVHTGEKPFKCNSCDISFSQNSNLRKHQRGHMRE